MPDYLSKPCPLCGKEAEYVEFTCNGPFTAPAELCYAGLEVWGMYSVPKEIICQSADYVHFVFPDGQERLVKMLPFHRDDFEAKAQAAYELTRTCEYPDCLRQGYSCFSLFQPLDPIGFFCYDHMSENGVCSGCRLMLAGFEDFDFSPDGLCAGCREDDSADFDDEEEWEN